MTNHRLISIGKITAPVGLRGEVKLYPYTDRIGYYNDAEVLIGGIKRRIEIVRYARQIPIIRVEDVCDRQQAEELRDVEVLVLESELSELPEDTYYLKDLIGCRVVDEADRDLGVISDVLQNSAQDIYEVIGDNGKLFMIPAVGEFILSIDIGSRELRVRIPEGLMDL